MIKFKTKDIVPLLVFLALVFFMIFYSVSFISKIIDYSYMKAEYNTDKKLLMKFTWLREKEKDIEVLIDKIDKQPVKGSENISLFEMIIKIAKKTGIYMVSFNPIKTLNKFVSIRITVRGNFLKILKFFELLEKSEYFLQIENFEIYSIDTGKGDTEARLSIKIYR